MENTNVSEFRQDRSSGVDADAQSGAGVGDSGLQGSTHSAQDVRSEDQFQSDQRGSRAGFDQAPDRERSQSDRVTQRADQSSGESQRGWDPNEKLPQREEFWRFSSGNFATFGRL